MIVSRIINGWTPFFFRRQDARPVALFRILSGLLCTVMFAVSLPNWHRFFGADGIISLHSPGLLNDRVNTPFGLFYWTEGIVPVGFWWLAAMAFSVAFTIGWKSRIATIGLYVLFESMLQRNPYLANGEDMVMRMCLLYLILIDVGSAWSVDAWLRTKHGQTEHGQPEVATIAGWPLRMMQINVALIYIISLPYKLAQDPGWVTGDALHWTVASDMWGPFNHPWITLAFGGVLRKVMTFGTVIVEAFFPLCVWFNPTRRLAIAGIAALHLGIALMIPNVTYFTLSMVCTFAVFLSRDDIELFVRWAEKLKELMQTDATGRMKSQNVSLSQQSGTSVLSTGR